MCDLKEIDSRVRTCRLTGVQLHSGGGAELPAQLRERLGPGLRILRVVHFGTEATEHTEALAQNPNIDALLVDSRTAAAVGGTGIAFDWDLAAQTLFKDARAQKRVAAGGLEPDNVARGSFKAIPW